MTLQRRTVLTLPSAAGLRSVTAPEFRRNLIGPTLRVIPASEFDA